MLYKVLREPLLHFLVGGLSLFILFEFLADPVDSVDDNVIVVDREALLTFMQYRMKSFQREKASAQLNTLSTTELQALIDEYTHEEAVYRKALELGLDRNDYVIKRRLMQKLEFINTGFVTSSTALSAEEVREYYESNRSDYYVEPYATFTHVFFGADTRGGDEADVLAEQALKTLNEKPVPFHEAPRHGERFLYHTNYVERTVDFITSHLGTEMTRALFELKPDDARWRGPFRSAYGSHLVMLTRKMAGKQPPLEDIEPRVRSDARQARIRTKSEQALQAIVQQYEVRVGLIREGEEVSRPKDAVQAQ